MCGFVGAVLPRGYSGDALPLFERAAGTLAHRGPDGSGSLAIPEVNAILGFQRLAIIDLARGDQPMSWGAHHIVFNGEVYNYRELREELAEAGETFVTASDTEVLLKLLGRYGPDALERVKGMFALAHVDGDRRRLTLARDRLGVKQLYFAERPEGVFFASEPKALVQLPWIRPTMDVERLAEYMTFRSVPAPATLFDGISKLSAGTYLQFDLGGARTAERRYWSGTDASSAAPAPGSGSPLDRLEDLFLHAIERRLVSDVPVGAFLSGGLDSSLIVAGIARLGHKDVETFSATFPGSPDDEADFSRVVSERFRLAQHVFPLAAGDFIATLDRWFELNDDPVADASSLPLMCVADVARREGRIVMLSGEGADELFGGYGSYHKFVGLRALGDLVPGKGVRAALARGLERVGVFGPQDGPRVREYLVHKTGYRGTAAQLGREELLRLLVPGLAETVDALPVASGRSLADLGAFDFQRRIPDDLLVRTDRATMGASVEARVPFLDHELVELVMGLPGRQRSLPGVSKVLLRRLALRWNVPMKTITHRKIGFQLPIADWFRGELKQGLGGALARRRVPGLDYDYVLRIFQDHIDGKGSYEEVLWRILTLEAWHARWISSEPVFPEGAPPPAAGSRAGH